MLVVESGFAMLALAIFIFSNLFLLSNILCNTSEVFSLSLSHTATSLFSKNSAFCSSCPGIGLISKIGNPDAKLSDVVSPPRLCYN